MKYRVVRADLKNTKFIFKIKNGQIFLDGQNVGLNDSFLNYEKIKEKLDQLIEDRYHFGIFTIEKDNDFIDIESFEDGKILDLNKSNYWEGTYSLILSRKDEEIFLEINKD